MTPVRYEYRRVHVVLRREGWVINHKKRAGSTVSSVQHAAEDNVLWCWAPACEDDNPCVAKGRQMFLAARRRWDDPGMLRKILIDSLAAMSCVSLASSPYLRSCRCSTSG